LSVESSPEFQKGLSEAAEGAYREWLFGGSYKKVSSKDEIADTLEDMQRQRKEIEEKSEEIRRHAEGLRRDAERMRLLANPHAREITETLRAKHNKELGIKESGLICPKCKDTDHNNRMNGKAWCMKCNLPLMSPEKAKEWKPKQPKQTDITFNPIDRMVFKGKR
jgi:ribosomal protein L37AE/L43A